MTNFLIEFRKPDGWSMQFMVKAKTQDKAVEHVLDHCGEGHAKVLGIFEQMETEKNMMRRSQ